MIRRYYREPEASGSFPVAPFCADRAESDIAARAAMAIATARGVVHLCQSRACNTGTSRPAETGGGMFCAGCSACPVASAP